MLPRQPRVMAPTQRNGGPQPTRVPDSDRTTARRRFIQLLGSASLLAIAGCSNATSKTSKEQVSYQDHSEENQQCSNCQFYTPPENGGDAGTCTRVQGDIAPEAWCNVYAEG